MSTSATSSVTVNFLGDDNGLSSTISSVEDNLNGLSGGIKKISAPLSDLADKILKVEAIILGMAAAIGTKAVIEASKFQDALADVVKVLNDDVTISVQDLQDEVVELSEKYGVAADEILGAVANFKQAGFTASEALSLQKNALDLVIAGDVDAAKASEILIASLKGMQAPAEDAARFMEALNNTSNNYATNLNELATGMAALSPILKTMGFSFDEGIGLITPIIEVFRSGSESANALKVGLISLLDDSKPVSEALANLGVSQKDLNGEMRSGKDIFYDVAVAFQTLDQNQKLVIASQIFGKDQAAKLILAFDQLGKVNEITANAMEVTGSVTNEVTTALGLASKQADIVAVSFNNLAKTLGDEILDSFQGTGISIAEIIQSFRDVIKAGGLDKIFDALNPQIQDFNKLLSGIAKALPEAFAGVDFSRLISSFGSLKDSVAGLFDNLDLTKPEDLRKVLQGLVDFIALFTEASSGIITGLEPLIEGIKQIFEGLRDLDSETIIMTGNFLGLGKSADEVADSIELFANATGSIVSSVHVAELAINGYNAALAAFSAAGITSFSTLASAVGSYLASAATVSASTGALVIATGAASYGIGTLINDATGLSTHIVDAAVAFDDLVFSVTGLGNSRNKNLEIERQAEEQRQKNILALKDEKKTTEDLTEIQKQSEEVRLSLKDELYAQASAANDVVLAYEDNAESLKEWEIANGLAFREIEKGTETTAKITDKTNELTEAQRLSIETTAELTKTLLELSSNERIAQLQFSAEIETANIQAETDKAIAIFEGLQTTIEATSQAASDMFGTLASAFADPNISRFDLLSLQDYYEKQFELEEKAVEKQLELIDKDIELKNAQIEQLENGEAAIKVVYDGGDPFLEAFLQDLVSRIRVAASLDGLKMITESGIATP